MTDYWWWWLAVDLSSDRWLMNDDWLWTCRLIDDWWMMTGCGPVVWQMTDEWWLAVDLSSDRLLMMMTGCGPVVWQITDEWWMAVDLSSDRLLMIDEWLWTCRVTDYWWMMNGCGAVVWQITDEWWMAVDLSSDRLLMNDEWLWTCRVTDYWWMMTGCGPVMWQIADEWWMPPFMADIVYRKWQVSEQIAGSGGVIAQNKQDRQCNYWNIVARSRDLTSLIFAKTPYIWVPKLRFSGNLISPAKIKPTPDFVLSNRFFARF
jgi:hypothetical protein